MALNNLLIRSDTSVQIGTGHIMRCLALAQAWQEREGEALFVMADMSSALENRLLMEGMKVVHLSGIAGGLEDATVTMDAAQKFNAQWVVVDGYHFGKDYQKLIKDAKLNLLFIDDYGHAGYYYADLVLNQNISADIDLYPSREPYTKLLLGTEYVLLRREFWLWRNWQRETQSVANKILVTLGGSDPDNVTLRVIRALQLLNIDGMEVIVIIGGSNPYHQILQQEISTSNLVITLRQNVNNMPQLMAWADIAIAAGGSTNWELAFMGLPSLVISVADNQIAIAKGLNQQGVISYLGCYQQVGLSQIHQALQELRYDRCKREIMSEKGQKLVDGYGGNRVVLEINKMLKFSTEEA